MRKLIIAAFLFVGIAGFAQDNAMSSNRQATEKFTPEQRNQLALKRMTAELGLDASQQKEMGKIIADASAKRDAMMAQRKANKDSNVKMTADERFKKQNEMLDEQIAMKARVKKILTPAQYEKWESNMKDRHEKMKNHMAKRKMKSDKTK